MNVGESAGLEYSVSNATSNSTTISSSDSAIVTVNDVGTLTGVSAGKAQITISASGVTKSFTVEVKTVPVEEIIIINEIDKIQLGEQYQFKASILPENATNKELLWSSDNEDVLKINSNGRITTESAGTATITCATKSNIEVKTTVEIFEILPESINCEDSVSLIVGDECDFQINILPEDANNKDFTVNCENENILSFNDSSLEAISEGETILHVETWNGIKKEIPVKVDIIPVENIVIEDATQYMFSNVLDKSGEIRLMVEIRPHNATYQDVVWSSSDEDVVSVKDSNFSINGTGKVTLSCTSHGDIVNSIDIQIINKDSIALVILPSGVVFIGAGVVVARRKIKQKTS